MGTQESKESYDEKMRRIGKDYWRNPTVVRQPDHSEKFGLHPSKSCSKLAKKQYSSEQNKSKVECFASYTFGILNKTLIDSYESRFPQPKEWKPKARILD